MDYEHKTKEDLQQIWDSSKKKFCKKIKSFFAEIVEQDTEVVTLCVGENGQMFQETSNTAHEGDVRITQHVELNNVIYNNQYSMSMEKFLEIHLESGCYVLTSYGLYETDCMVHPIPEKIPLKTVVELTRPIVFEPTWGGEMKAMKGAFLVKEDNGFYCINPVEFYSTHQFHMVVE